MLWQIVILIGFAVGMYLAQKGDKNIFKNLDKKQHPLFPLYGLAYFLSEKMGLMSRQEKSKSEKRFRLLYVESEESIQTIHILHRCKQGAFIIFFVVIGSIVSLILEVRYITTKPENSITRRNYGEGKESHQIILEKEGREKEAVDLEVLEKQYSDQEYEEKLEEAKAYVAKTLKGENETLDKINRDLKFSSVIPGNDIDIAYSSLDLDIIDGKGAVHNEELKEPTIVNIRVEYTYLQKNVLEILPVCVVPNTKTKEERSVEEVKEELIALEEQSRVEKKLELPAKIRNFQISLTRENENYSISVLFFSTVLGVLLAFRSEEEINTELKERNRQLLKDYPEVINKLVLLLGAGMNIRGAITKLAMDYQESKKESDTVRYVYEEILVTVYELQSGISETQAFLHMGNQLKLAPYLKLANYLIQNQTKGTGNLIELLEQEEIQAMDTRREQARRQGEEASTRLLMPMLILLIVVLILVMYPAIINFQF